MLKMQTFMLLLLIYTNLLFIIPPAFPVVLPLSGMSVSHTLHAVMSDIEYQPQVCEEQRDCSVATLCSL